MYSRIRNYAHSARELGFVPAVLNKLQRIRLKHMPRNSTLIMRSKHTTFL
jgi:hypothetical protein